MIAPRLATVAQDIMAIDVLIITALKKELDALRAAVPGGMAAWTDRKDSQGFPYHTVELACPQRRTLRIAAAWAGAMGRMIVASRASRLLGELEAGCLAICGICAGRRGESTLGDVIIADRVWSYDSGKATDTDFYHDITTYNLEANWAVEASYLADECMTKVEGLADVVLGRPPTLEWYEDWFLRAQLEHETAGKPPPEELSERPRGADWTATLDRLEGKQLVSLKDDIRLTESGKAQAKRHRSRHPDGLPPAKLFKIHVAPIATGEALQRDPGLFDRLDRVGRKTLGAEMEAAAVGYVAWANRIPSIVIKAVSDHGDLIKDDRFHDFACEVSAHVLLGFLKIHVRIHVASAPAARSSSPSFLLSDDEVEHVAEAALGAGLADSRTALLAPLAPAFRATIPREPKPVDQLRTDLHFLNQAGRLADRSRPLEQWLQGASQVTRYRQEEAVFARAITLLDRNTSTSP